jgi:hypothetical protein
VLADAADDELDLARHAVPAVTMSRTRSPNSGARSRFSATPVGRPAVEATRAVIPPVLERVVQQLIE